MSGFREIKNLLPYCFPPLENVGETIAEHDFNSIHYSPFYNEYKPALKLARILLKKFDFSVRSDGDLKNKTLPFRINMPELFERYCEALLRDRYDDLLAGYGREGYSETRSGSRRMRPDFLLPSLNMIIDSKYKFWVKNAIGNEDLRQLSAYGRYKPLLDKLKTGYESPTLQFLYPSEAGSETIDLEDAAANRKETDFIKIKKYPVKIE
jgi:5-methylcytosine-specific restriction endonuclease McrBC regulatory subunit McrC